MLRDRLRGELATIAPAILTPGEQALPGTEPAAPAPLDATDIEELVRSVAERHVAEEVQRWRVALTPAADAATGR